MLRPAGVLTIRGAARRGVLLNKWRQPPLRACSSPCLCTRASESSGFHSMGRDCLCGDSSRPPRTSPLRSSDVTMDQARLPARLHMVGCRRMLSPWSWGGGPCECGSRIRIIRRTPHPSTPRRARRPSSARVAGLRSHVRRRLCGSRSTSSEVPSPWIRAGCLADPGFPFSLPRNL